MANTHAVNCSALPSSSQEPSQPPDNVTRGERALPRREVGGDTVQVQAQKEISLYAFSPAERKVTSDLPEGGKCVIAFDGENVADTKESDEKSMYYDCFAVLAATSHITNRRDAFLSHQPTHDTLIEGVGSSIARAEGKGTIELESQCGGKEYVLRLQDVLYVPNNKYNIFSLGRCTAVGGQIFAKDGTLSLISNSGKCVAQGTKTENNLYKMRFTIRKPTASWETWHKRYGHIGYADLQKLLDNRLVEGFAVDIPTTKPACIACAEGKQSENTFSAFPNCKTTVGELTHIDLRGKYGVTSVNGHQYYISFIDEWTRYITVEFLQSKSQATETVKRYLSYLKNHDKKPRAIRVDVGKDIVTSELSAWCAGHGVGIQMAAPRSPLQNPGSVLVEQIDRTLVGLARTMIAAKGLPEFLWEPAIAHAAYLTNRSCARTNEDPSTPYEKWNNTRPNVSHLREFGAPVWIVPQGQMFRRELPPPVKGHGRAFVGYDKTRIEGSKSVKHSCKYYDAETKKVLTSGNFRFMTFPEKDSQVEGIIVVAPDTITREGESSAGPGGSTQRATCGEARDGANADTSNARGSRSLNNGAPNRLKRRLEDLDVGESAGPAVTRVKVPKY